MIVKQLSIFVENKSGRLCDITELFKNAGIDIRALSIADTTELMKAAAKNLDFLQAAQYRDEIVRLQESLEQKK